MNETNDEFDKLIAESRRNRDEREKSYREQALKMFSWVCAHCGREFNHQNLKELTVHHKDHDHHYNPADGSNWELLCIYCHDHEHSKHLDHKSGELTNNKQKSSATYHPFENLKSLLKKSE